jgi:hypothetical protein
LIYSEANVIDRQLALIFPGGVSHSNRNLVRDLY